VGKVTTIEHPVI